MKPDNGSPATIDEYIAAFPPDVQDILKKVRATIQKIAPDAEETIKYRIPTFVLNENLVHFAAFRKHIGFYPTPSGIEEFKSDLAGYKFAKGSVQFPIDKPLPLSLIEKIVQFRVNEVRRKERGTMKDRYQSVYEMLHRIYQKHRRKYPKNGDSKQMCCMWSTRNPPDIVEGTPPFVDIENTFSISISDDDAVELYDMDLDEAARKIMEIRNEQCQQVAAPGSGKKPARNRLIRRDAKAAP